MKRDKKRSKKRYRKKCKTGFVVFLGVLLLCFNYIMQEHVDTYSDYELNDSQFENNNLDEIPKFFNEPYVVLNENKPDFTAEEKENRDAFENYSELDGLGRCGAAYANICKEIMPTEERGPIGQIKPSGWQLVKYDIVDGKYLYNRCHLIGYQLAGENANEKNLITGTRYMNVSGMLPFENMVADYVKRTDNHVLYRVTPVYEGSDLVASGVEMEAYSVEDKGSGICFHVFVYNCQPGIGIDYATGDSWLIENTEEIMQTGREVLEQTKEEQETVIRPKVKGIFVTGPMAGTSNMKQLIELVDETELNAIVMDIKNDEGRITYDMQIPAVQETGAGIRYVQDMEALIEECKEKDIYLIARIVAFKDPFLVKIKPEWCVHNKDGSIFQDKNGLAWLNPYETQVWEYLLDIAEEALRMGFDEVQFDYIRFSTDKGMENVDFGQPGQDKNREEIIGDFVEYAAERVHEAGGAVSADVYGMVIDSRIDQEIVGQNYVEMSRYLDYISPMVYPSHYGPYNYDIPVPDAEPYRLVLTALQASKKALAGILAETVSGNVGMEYSTEEIAALMPMKGIQAQVRPWLQDFTATWVKGHIDYGPEEIRAQIQAVYDAGYEEWILWNASNRYTEDGLLKEN